MLMPIIIADYVVGDMDVKAGELMYGETSWADQIQDVTTGVSGEVDMLLKVKALLKFHEFSCKFTVSVVNGNIGIT